MREENALGRALREHRTGHPGCEGCPDYLAIVEEYTEPRKIWEGPTMAYTRLSILEAK